MMDTNSFIAKPEPRRAKASFITVARNALRRSVDFSQYQTTNLVNLMVVAMRESSYPPLKLNGDDDNTHLTLVTRLFISSRTLSISI